MLQDPQGAKGSKDNGRTGLQTTAGEREVFSSRLVDHLGSLASNVHCYMRLPGELGLRLARRLYARACLAEAGNPMRSRSPVANRHDLAENPAAHADERAADSLQRAVREIGAGRRAG